ncbi:MAG: acetylxylan esterase [Bacteroidaceae bacterium]|nr:acetylxylan esterase [Bacteroidaceae bacterium]
MLAASLRGVPVMGQIEVNYDESKVPEYVLPDVLTCADGTVVSSVREWELHRRPEVMALLSNLEYGVTPRGMKKVRVKYCLLQENPHALDGLATMQQVQFTFMGQGKTVEALLLVFIPNARQGRVPVFIGYNFRGNHSVLDDENILYSPYFQQLENREDPVLQRGNQSSRWAVRDIISRGYALATMCYQDIFPDHAEGGPKSVTALCASEGESDTAWQALGAWAWGSSRIADWVVRQRWANKHQLAIMGHSRQGKAALWAGAQDKRFAVVISNDSGCGGAALSKRAFGERVGRITNSFPHWFCPNFSLYAGREQELPFDQHELLALIAPRYLYVASAQEDHWADPRGEYLAAYYASPVYALYGFSGLPSSDMPAIHKPIMNHIGYHIRAGVHDVTDYDWACYLDFCDKAFGR